MHWRWGKIAKAILLLAILGSLGYVCWRPLRAADYFRAAKRSLDQFDFKGAFEHLHDYLELRPDDQDAVFLAAQTARRAQLYSQSAKLLARCESSPPVLLEKVLLTAQQGQISPEVVRLLRRNVPVNISETLALEALAQGYLYAYCLGDARDCVERLIELEPGHASAYLWRGYVREGLLDHARAAEDYRQVIKLQPNHDVGRVRLAEILLALSQPRQALAEFKNLEQRGPTVNVRLGLARCRRLLGETAEARRTLLAIIQEEPNPVALRELGLLAQDEGMFAEAENYLQQAITAAPFDPDACYALAQCLHRQKKTDRAQKLEARWKKIDADLQRLRQLHQDIGKEPNHPMPRFQAGEICLRNGQTAEALRWFAGALQVDPQHAPTRKALADYQRRARSLPAKQGPSAEVKSGPN
jgi:tetratricopeptide (TPR) repeat protein